MSKNNKTPLTHPKEPFLENTQEDQELFESYLEKAYQDPEFLSKLTEDFQDVNPKPIKASSRKKTLHPKYVIDLHGKTCEEAEHALETFVLRSFSKNPSQQLEFQVITGKGLHSNGRGKLIREIYYFAKSFFSDQIIKIDSPPFELHLNEVPLKGYFDMTLKRTKKHRE